MAISIAMADVKRKCMIASTDTTYDTSVSSLIAEMQPAIEYTIADMYLSDTTNTGLQAVLKLGLLEMISGEFLQQLAREFGHTEQFSIAGMTVGELKDRGPELIEQGINRISPFLKSVLPMMGDSRVTSTTKDLDLVFSLEEV